MNEIYMAVTTNLLIAKARKYLYDECDFWLMFSRKHTLRIVR